jgi:uncharacterized integral membrane protein
MRILLSNRFPLSVSIQKGFATRKLLVSLAIIALGFIFVFENQTVVDVDILLTTLSASIGVWIVGALILGLVLGFRDRIPAFGVGRKVSAVGRKIAAAGIRYESNRKLFGLPLVCIASGASPERNEDRGLARGVIAVGDISIGFLSIGGLAFGAFSVGGASLGLFSVGGLSIGILALGGAAVGLLAAVGGVAIGYNVVGEVGIGIHHFEEAHIYILDLLTF